MISNVNKPIPVSPQKNSLQFHKSVDVDLMIDALKEGNHVIIADFYSNGLLLLKELKKHLNQTLPNKSFLEQREYRSEYQKLSNRILMEIKNHSLAVKKAPAIGWLEKLYPESEQFYLLLPQIQGLNSAWQWYIKGVSIPVLRNKIHPYYGVYFPTRFDHLIVFDNWLKRYEGPKKSAMDIGIGSGVLSLQMMKYGFQKVYGTDVNINAIIGLKEFMGDTKLSRKIELDHGNLFAKWDKLTELIVFNPPWLPKSHDLNRLDEAMYYHETLFEEFFSGAKQRLLPEGKIVLLFSNLAQITGAAEGHPIEKELAEGGRFKLENCYKKRVKSASSKTKRNQTWRDSEEVELWELSRLGAVVGES